jgi:hypothetical protein
VPINWYPDEDGDLIATTETHELFVFTPPAETADAQGEPISWGVDDRRTGDVVASGIAESVEVAKRAAEAALPA